jgi:SAM-dependent methyltransferase
MEKMKSQWTENSPLRASTHHYSYHEFLIYYFHHLEVPRHQHIQVLQLGSGDRFLRDLCQEYKIKLSVLDKQPSTSPEALEQLGINFIERNLTEYQQKDFFDVIVDHHCLHCLHDQDKIEVALRNIYSSLKKGGLFIGEMMIEHPKLSLSEDFIYRDHKIFCKEPFVPLRWAPPARKIENILNEVGFIFKLFRAYEDLNFVIDLNERSRAFSTEPQVLRFICTK